MIILYIDGIENNVNEQAIDAICTKILNEYFDAYSFISDVPYLPNKALDIFEDHLLFSIRKIYWDIQQNLLKKYSFGSIFKVTTNSARIKGGMLIYMERINNAE